MARPNGSGRRPASASSPGAAVSIAGANKTVTAGNPELDPYRAKAYDLGVEWYFAQESLLSLALFYKDIDSFVQIVRATDNFTGNPLGLPDSVALAACGATIPTRPRRVSAAGSSACPRNTEGGTLKGFEISYQQPFTFLPGFVQQLRRDPELHRRRIGDRLLRAAGIATA